jgi:RNA polymerase sigma-B factor
MDRAKGHFNTPPIPDSNVETTHDGESGALGYAQTSDIVVASHSAEPAQRAVLEEIIVWRFAPMVRNIARRYAGRNWSGDDLIQVANLALVRAIRRFDLARGDFEAYAKATISGEIKNYLRDYSWIIKPPRRLREMESHVIESIEHLVQERGEFPDSTSIADHLGTTVEEVGEALVANSCHRPTSIDQSTNFSNRPLSDSLCADEDPYAEIETHVTLLQICTDLTNEERHLIRLRFFECLSQSEIAGELGISQMQVSRRLAALIGKLRVKAMGTGEVA